MNRQNGFVFPRWALLLAFAWLTAAQASGPLRISPVNPRYFTDDSGKAVYLTGSHTWNNLQDMGPTDPPVRFDFEEYLRFLDAHDLNFIRLWRWELVSWNTAANHEQGRQIHFATPHPWPRTAAKNALDGKPQFDLSKFNDAYFERLRARVSQAQRHGIYVSVMLFEGWGLQFVPEGWRAHPFNPANNLNGIDGDPNHDTKGLGIYTLAHPQITSLQEAYVRKVIDSINDLDNVLYEISNENYPPSTAWQFHMIRFVQDYEKGKPRQHPVGMTFQYKGGKNATLLASPADWISPNPEAYDLFDYRTNPPASDGSKVILSDTDHLWGIGGDSGWAWKSFLRGLNPIFMDPYKREILQGGSPDLWEPVRRALGDTRYFAQRMDLLRMSPRLDLASTGYCLANPGTEYLVYLPKTQEAFTLQVQAGTYHYEWFKLPAREPQAEGDLAFQTGQRRFELPFTGAALLHLRAR